MPNLKTATTGVTERTKRNREGQARVEAGSDRLLALSVSTIFSHGSETGREYWISFLCAGDNIRLRV